MTTFFTVSRARPEGAPRLAACDCSRRIASICGNVAAGRAWPTGTPVVPGAALRWGGAEAARSRLGLRARRAPPASARPLLSPVAGRPRRPAAAPATSPPTTTSTRATSTRRTVHAGARAPVPPVYGSGRPAFSPPTVLRGRGRIFPAPARGEPRTPSKSTPPAGPQGQGWTGPSRHQGSSVVEVVEVHPLAISQDRPSRPKPPGQGRSSGRALHLDPGALPSYPEGGRRREDEPPPAERAFAPNTRRRRAPGRRGLAPCHPRARTGPEQGALSTSQAPGKPELTRGAAVGYRP